MKKAKRRSKSPVKVTVTHPGILKVPANKKITQLSVEHFKKLAKTKGHAAISRALVNIQRWNKRKNATLSRWAKRMNEKLKKSLEK